MSAQGAVHIMSAIGAGAHGYQSRFARLTLTEAFVRRDRLVVTAVLSSASDEMLEPAGKLKILSL